MIYLSILLACICLAQFLHIKTTNKQLKEWLDDLKEIRQNPQQKLFVKKNGILSDITFELNALLADNQKQIAQLKKADAANKQILTNLSHDVRTPLASLTGYLEALSSQLADVPEEYLAITYQKALSLKSLIDMLFEWCKLSANEQTYHLLPEDINELTRETIIDWLPLLEKEHIELKADLSDEEWIVILDPAAYKRIVNNLIQNAISHGNSAVIKIQARIETEEIIVKISNDGTPIPEDKLPYVFDRLYKCDEARSQTGSGLGLTIARELVLAMGGTISVASDTHETVFTLLFPKCKEKVRFDKV